MFLPGAGDKDDGSIPLTSTWYCMLPGPLFWITIVLSSYLNMHLPAVGGRGGMGIISDRLNRAGCKIFRAEHPN